ncbi:MAG: hypothetical protein EHM35_12825 [Planctomycetaceae bacterium]|nr:MAG: hypothetical protein EHM35_12825 [Planctomycetaceae bacterium]
MTYINNQGECIDDGCLKDLRQGPNSEAAKDETIRQQAESCDQWRARASAVACENTKLRNENRQQAHQIETLREALSEVGREAQKWHTILRDGLRFTEGYPGIERVAHYWCAPGGGPPNGWSVRDGLITDLTAQCDKLRSSVDELAKANRTLIAQIRGQAQRIEELEGLLREIRDDCTIERHYRASPDIFGRIREALNPSVPAETQDKEPLRDTVASVCADWLAGSITDDTLLLRLELIRDGVEGAIVVEQCQSPAQPQEDTHA